MVTLWNTIFKFRSMEIDGYKPIELITNKIVEEGQLDEVLLESGLYNTNPAYTYAPATIWRCWGILLCITILSAIVAVSLLQFIDRDKR